MELISGGARSYDGWTWQELAKGSYVNYGQYIVYIVAGGDALNGDKLTIYPTILR